MKPAASGSFRWLLAACALALALSADAAPRRRAVAPAARPHPGVQHVIVVILENTDAPVALQQPFLAELATRGALLTNYHGITHPSQPNYIAMVAGSVHGVTGSDPVTIDASHLGDLFERRGLSWKVYAEDYPGDCFTGAASRDYVRRHVPFISFSNVQSNHARCAATPRRGGGVGRRSRIALAAAVRTLRPEPEARRS